LAQQLLQRVPESSAAKGGVENAADPYNSAVSVKNEAAIYAGTGKSEFT